MDYITLADQILGHKLEDGLESLGGAVGELVESEKGNGLAICKILHTVNFHWKDIEHDEYPTFDDWACGYTGYVKATVQRRICSWEFVDQYVPGQHKETLLKNWSVGMLSRGYRVAVKHIRYKKDGNYGYEESGYEIDGGDWLALSECVDMPMLIERLGKITDKEPNSNRVSFSVDLNGEIRFYRGKKDVAVIGYLRSDSKSELVRDGISELMEKIGAR